MSDSTQAEAAPAARKRRGRGAVYPLIIVVIVAAGLLLVVKSSFSSGTYSLEIADVQHEPTRYVGRDVKVVGKVKEGSISTRTEADRVTTRFVIHDGKGQEVLIVYPHNVPDPFKEGRQVIVEGRYDQDEAGDHHVLCSKLTVKCPSKYQEEGGGGTGFSDDYYKGKYGAPGGPTSGDPRLPDDEG